jgi:hypothetical protein
MHSSPFSLFLWAWRLYSSIISKNVRDILIDPMLDLHDFLHAVLLVAGWLHRLPTIHHRECSSIASIVAPMRLTAQFDAAQSLGCLWGDSGLFASCSDHSFTPRRSGISCYERRTAQGRLGRLVRIVQAALWAAAARRCKLSTSHKDKVDRLLIFAARAPVSFISARRFGFQHSAAEDPRPLCHM